MDLSSPHSSIIQPLSLFLLHFPSHIDRHHPFGAYIYHTRSIGLLEAVAL